MRTSDEKRSFAERLILAVKARGIPPGPTKLADLLCLHAQDAEGLEPVSPQAVDKWLKGKSRPGPERMRTLASLLGVSEQWLRTGMADFDQGADSDPDGLAARNESERMLVQRFRNLSRDRQMLVHQLVSALSGPTD